MTKKLILPLRKSMAPTNGVVSGPQKGILFTTLTQDEYRHALSSGRLPTKEHFFSPYPRVAADDARLGLFGNKEIPRANKPVFLVGVRMQSTSGLSVVPHSVSIYNKNTPIPLGDIKEVHEIRVNTESGFHQFRRMGGVNKSMGGTEPSFTPPVPKSVHAMTPNEFNNTKKVGFQTGTNHPDQVMSLHTPTYNDAQNHQQLTSWTQRIKSPESLEYNRPIIRKFLAQGTHSLYKAPSTSGGAFPAQDNATTKISTPEDFDAKYDNIHDSLQDPLAGGNLKNKKISRDELMNRGKSMWAIGDSSHYAPQEKAVYGSRADLTSPDIWTDSVLPYMEKNKSNDYDQALIDHAKNNIAHQQTYGQGSNRDLFGNEQDNQKLRSDHSMWHFVDKSPALKSYLQAHGHTGAEIPNFLSTDKSPENLSLMADNNAIASKAEKSSDVQQRMQNMTAPNSIVAPSVQKTVDNPYDNPVPPIEHSLRPKDAVFNATSAAIQNHGLGSPKLSQSGFMQMPDNSLDNEKIAEPHVAADVAKSAVATAFGINPRVLDRATMKFSQPPILGNAHGAGLYAHESVWFRNQDIANAKKGPQQRSQMIQTMVHELTHAVQDESRGSTTKEDNSRYRKFNAMNNKTTIPVVEGYTDLASHIINSSLLGKGVNHSANIHYDKEVQNIVKHVMEKYKDDPASAMKHVMQGAMHPDQNADEVTMYPKETNPVKKADIDHFIGKMVAYASGEDPNNVKRKTTKEMADHMKNIQSIHGG